MTLLYNVTTNLPTPGKVCVVYYVFVKQKTSNSDRYIVYNYHWLELS